MECSHASGSSAGENCAAPLRVAGIQSGAVGRGNPKRIFCGLTLWLVVGASLWAQSEPCLAGVDSPGCGIKITMNPPLKSPDENILWVPNEITIDVPLRLHATKVQLKSGPTGTAVADAFKPFAETAHYKKAGGLARFELQIKSCPEADNAFLFYIFPAHLPYPIAVNSQPFECEQVPAK